METKKVKRVVITSIATVVGIFGGVKVYSNKKKKREKKLAEIEAEIKNESEQ